MANQLIKICGLSTPETLAVAVDAGADLVGFVHFPKSPRHVSLETAGKLMHQADGKAKRVILTVDPDDQLLDEIMTVARPDLLQLHGSETIERTKEIKTRYNIPLIKALGVATAHDLVQAQKFEGIADLLLLDAKPAPTSEIPGGNGIPFDWELLAHKSLGPQYMLSGGLTPDNIDRAIRLTHMQAVDVSSGVESSRGIKDIDKIQTFIANARAAWRSGV
ncbi:phosphoribosylanthranilate isomerase [Microvirga sp. W0021]|uniref:N-(5'-phosphoribosyl)anthranilate isomerase n=1 Tax=Hohaiivirga grylli TaxID=3133970 RepID=A0ABV0BJ34_9HYPH